MTRSILLALAASALLATACATASGGENEQQTPGAEPQLDVPETARLRVTFRVDGMQKAKSGAT